MVMKLQIFNVKKLLRYSNQTFLAAISLDSALKKDGNYYPQMFFTIFKKVMKHIINDLESFSDDSDIE